MIESIIDTSPFNLQLNIKIATKLMIAIKASYHEITIIQEIAITYIII